MEGDDDVFEAPEETERRRKNKATKSKAEYFYDPNAILLEKKEMDREMNREYENKSNKNASGTSSGYPGYHPSREALLMYGANEDPFGTVEVNRGRKEQNDDGWLSYSYEDEEDPAFDVTINHKTILLGDSGVGKTSILVKYTTGGFKAGSFSATVGIALTVLLLGDSGVGKTCLLVSYGDPNFYLNHFITTVGIDFRNKVVMVDHTRVKLQIWDTAGQERFRSVTHAYYRDAHALLLVYDVTNKTSFENIRAWLEEIREYAQEDVVIMLLGNKADCDSRDRNIKIEDGLRLAREYNVSFMETSAKTGFNVELSFLKIAKQLKNRKAEPIDESRFNIHDFLKEKAPQRSVCPPCNL